MTNAKMAAKIQALLTLAEHPGTPEHERLAAAEKAAELMEKYAIDELMARGAKEQNADQIIRRDYVYNGVYSKTSRTACSVLAEALDMQALYRDGHNDEVTVVVYGFESDFGKFETLLASLAVQMNTAFKLWTKENRESWAALNSRDRYYSKRSFLMGYGVGFAGRVQAGRNHAVKDSRSGTELVLVDRKTRVKDHVSKAHPNPKKSGAVLINSAYHHGRAAGQRANTGETTIGTRKGVK